MSLARQNYHEECEAGINKQINLELYASYVYMSMAYHFDRDDVALPGFHKFMLKQSDEGPGLMIAAGVVVIIVAIVGCLGAAKENRFFLISFLVMITLIFILELTVGILAFVYSSKIKGEIRKSIREKMNQQYGESDDVTESIDKLQRENKCCGDTGGSSWNGTTWYREEQRKEQGNEVPDSCCKTETPGCGVRTHPSNINNEGCLTQVEEFFQHHFSILAIVGIGVACIQLIGIIVTVCILRFVEEY